MSIKDQNFYILPTVVCRCRIWGFVYWHGWTGFAHGGDLAGRGIFT